MKKYFLLLILSIVILTGNAQTKNDRSLLGAIESLRTAMINADAAALERLVSDQLSYGHSNGHIDNSKEFVDKIASGQSDFVRIDITEQTISISGNTAIIRHLMKADTNDNGKPGSVQLRILLVWQKKGGQWKLLARQAVKMT